MRRQSVQLEQCALHRTAVREGVVHAVVVEKQRFQKLRERFRQLSDIYNRSMCFISLERITANMMLALT